MAMDFIGLSVGMGYTDETVIGGGALKGKNCVVSNIEEVADGVNVTFQWTLDDGTVKTDTAFIPSGTQGETGVDGKSAYEIWLEAGNTGTEEDFLISLVGEKGADGTMTFEDLTEEQKAQLKGEDGFSPIITENADNTDDVYKLDIETKDGILTTPNLKGQNGEVTGSAYLATGSIDMENETVTFDQTFEEIKTAYLEGKAILAEMLVEGEAKYIFNPLYVLGDAIAFEWINSSAKLGVQINLMEDNSTALSVTSLEGSEGSEALNTLVVTGNYSVDDDDNWTVSNIDKTFVEINEAITINRDVVLRLYPEGDTTNPYILYPTMHYANMGTTFSLMVSDEGQISGLSVMITKDNQVMATRNEYDFEALKKSVSDGKSAVAGAITAKGIETATDAEFATMAENIGKIESNTPLTLKHSNITNTNFTNTTVCGNGVIVAFRNNLLYCSHDGGVTWKTTSLDMTNATNNCTMVYAEKHDIFIACISGMGIYTSYDGDNWTLRLSSTQANKLYYDTTTGICLAGSTVGAGSSGLWYSVNGYTWSSDSRQASKKVTYLGGAGGRLYAVIDGASHVSSDGYSWSTITAFSQYEISVIKYEQGLYMACILGVNQNQSWYYSYDGINFTQASVTFTSTTYGVGFNDMRRISTETWVVALYTGIYYTTNRGKAWSVSNLGTSTGNWAFFAYKEKFYAGSCAGPGTTYGGIQYSTDGKTWSATTGISGANFKFYCVNDRLFASCSTGVYLLNSDGISWTQIANISDIIYGDNDILITAGGSYSTNGIDWKDIDISNLDITSFNISKVYRCGSNLVVASTTSSNGMFYSTLLK